jgi:hypothetical protein
MVASDQAMFSERELVGGCHDNVIEQRQLQECRETKSWAG